MEERGQVKIGFDVSQTAENKAGCGFVADQLITYLLKHDENSEYLLYPTFYSYRYIDYHKATYIDVANCKLHFNGMSFKEMIKGWDTQMNDRTAWLGNPDIIHSNNFSCKKDHHARIVYTLYDLVPIKYPQFTTEENRLICFNGLFEASLYADHCIAISENTKFSFLNYFPYYPPERITVIPLGVRSSIAPITNQQTIKNIVDRMSISGEFWLGVGTLEPRKNYSLLVDAFLELDDERTLVIAGSRGWLDSDLMDKIKNADKKDKIKFLGYVSDEELSALYSACFAFIYPSFYEGFGLPVLEALHCEAAVITSKISSLPEVGGEAVLYIDPESKNSLIDRMRLLINNPTERKELKSKAQKQAARFTWDDAAKITLDVYHKTVEDEPWMGVNSSRHGQ